MDLERDKRAERRAAYWANINSRQHRNFLMESISRNNIHFQMLATRRQRGWTQADLAQRAGVSEERIARIESSDNGRLSLRMLQRLAAAFDVALIVRFVPFAALVDYLVDLSPEDLAVPAFADLEPGEVPTP